MSTQTTISQLKELGLHGMAEAFEAMMILPSQKRPGLDRAVEKMVQTGRHSRLIFSSLHSSTAPNG